MVLRCGEERELKGVLVREVREYKETEELYGATVNSASRWVAK